VSDYLAALMLGGPNPCIETVDLKTLKTMNVFDLATDSPERTSIQRAALELAAGGLARLGRKRDG
jgi:hypothetical protein